MKLNRRSIFLTLGLLLGALGWSWSGWSTQAARHGRAHSLHAVRSALAPLATSIVVNSTADDTLAALAGNATCDLREAIAAANTNAAIGQCPAGMGGADTINFSVTGTITLVAGELSINESLTIQGPGANQLTINGNNAARVFNLSGSSLVATFSGLTIANGRAQGGNVSGGSAGNGRGGGIFNNSGATINVTNCTLSGNSATGGASSGGSGNNKGGAGQGGGIWNFGGTLNVTNSTFFNNSATGGQASGGSGNSNGGAGQGGGILNFEGTLNVTNSTFSGNTATGGAASGINTNLGGNGQGGAIYHLNGTTSLRSDTLFGNSATGGTGSGSDNSDGGSGLGGGISNAAGAVNGRNTIIAQSTASTFGIDIIGTFTSQGFNLIGDNSGATLNNQMATDQVGTGMLPLNPLLDPLANNGGPTPTQRPLTGSPAIDKGHSSGLAADQRGLPRPYDFPNLANAAGGDGAEIGAFEIVPLTLAPTSLTSAATAATGTITINAESGYAWSAASNAPDFIQLTSATSGTGNGALSFSVAANSTTSRRSGTIAIDGATFTVRQGAQFLDVPVGTQFYQEIGKLSAAGVTLGCGGGNYCPDASVTREQMAIFIVRALGDFNPPTPATATFEDVPNSGPTEFSHEFVEKLVSLGITAGCQASPRLYCPTSNVTREQMAIFVVRALGFFNPPTPATATFADVPNAGPTEFSHEFVEKFVELGITSGCAAGPPRLYCPTAPVTRRQMAVFLVRAFNL